MDKSKQSEVLAEIAQKIFEEAAFALVDPPEESLSVDREQTFIAVSVNFTGPFSGIISLSVVNELAIMFAANMLGIDEDDPEADKKSIDALKEIVNMICGNFLPAIAGREPEFRIDAPREIPNEEFSRILKGDYGSIIEQCLYVEEFKTRLVYVERN